MILVVDIGNTRIKWACVSGRDLVDPGESRVRHWNRWTGLCRGVRIA